MGKAKTYSLGVLVAVAVIAFILGMFLDKWFAKGISD